MTSPFRWLRQLLAGASISLLKLNDERLALLNAPARSPFFQEA